MFQKNIEAIRAKNPQLAEKLEKINIEDIKDIIVAEAETKDLIIGYKELALHSTFDPIREANALWNKSVKTELKKNDIQVVFGLGLGYLFKRAYVNSGSKILVFEPFTEILRFVLEHVDLSAEFSDNRVYISDNVRDLIARLKSDYLKGDRTEFLFLPAYASLAKDELEDLTSRIVKVMEEKSSDVNTIFKLSLSWTVNFINNLPGLFDFRPLGFFRDVFADKTALVISAGPSLGENIEKIKGNRDKFVIIAVGKALKILVENDIIPDFATFADARNMNHQTKGAEREIENINIIITSKTDSRMSRLKARNKILYLTETEHFTGLFQKSSGLNPGSFRSASSISIINYFIAMALGFRTIAFTGLDLAFPGNKTYASGEALEIDEKGCLKLDDVISSGKKIEYVNDINGNPIPTRDDYLLFIRQFEEILEEETGLCRVINTSKRGAYINGMEYVDFDTFTGGLQRQDADVSRVIADISAKTSAAWTECMEKVTNEVYGTIPEIRQINEKTALVLNEVKNTIESLEKDDAIPPGYNGIDELKQKFNDLRDRIIGNSLLQNCLQGELWLYTRDYRTENLMDRVIILNNLRVEEKLFKSVYVYSATVLSAMENSIQSIQELNRI